MITLLILFIIAIIGLAVALICGAGFMLVFGDLIFAIAVIGFIIYKIIKRK